MKRLSRLAACLLALTLTACTAAETAVPAATAPPTAAPSPTAAPTAAPQATPLPYDDLSYVPEFGFQQKQTYQPDEYNRLYLDTYSFNDRTVLVGPKTKPPPCWKRAGTPASACVPCRCAASRGRA